MGLELSFGLLLGLVKDGKVPLNRLLHAMSTGPARVIGIEAPTLREGASAELTLINPDLVWQAKTARIHSKSQNTPFLDRPMTGRVVLTFAQGEIVYDLLRGTA
jgi:dihydroorotase